MINSKIETVDDSYRNLIESLKQEENKIPTFDVVMVILCALGAVTAYGALVYLILKSYVL